jgi:hypothetical protein
MVVAMGLSSGRCRFVSFIIEEKSGGVKKKEGSLHKKRRKTIISRFSVDGKGKSGYNVEHTVKIMEEHIYGF